MLAGVSVLAWPASAEETEHLDQYRVAEIRAHSYYPVRGEFDERDLLDPTLFLGNMPFGEGDAKDPSEITLVLVTVEGPSFASGTKGAVELHAQAVGASPAVQSMPLWSLFAKGRRVTVPFLVHGTGCEKLKLEARITGVRGNPLPKTVTIPFFCRD